MKGTLKIFSCSVLIVLCSFMQKGEKRIMPASLKTLDGKSVNSSSFSNNGKPIILVFWISFHKNPVWLLDEIAEVYDNWKKETGVKLIAVAEDDSRTSCEVKSKVNAKGWEYEFYLDPTQDFKRAMSINDVPHTMIINGDGKVVWEKVGYTVGDENKIYEELKKLNK